MLNIISGKIKKAQKVVIYGPEGIGKTTLAAQFPGALFIDTEGGSGHLDVRRIETPSSWTKLKSDVSAVIATVQKSPGLCKTLVIDTADWAEKLCKDYICSVNRCNSIEDPGYGKGYTFLAEEWGRLLNLLSDLVERGVNVVLCAHSTIRKFEKPDEMGAYDRYELKLEKKTAPLVKEWADMLLFCNYKTSVIQSSDTRKNKVVGGKRVIYTQHTPAWDAKNRHDLPSELPMDFKALAEIFSDAPEPAPIVEEVKTEPVPAAIANDGLPPMMAQAEPPSPPPEQATQPTQAPAAASATERPDYIPPALWQLMQADGVTEDDVKAVVSDAGYYSRSTSIAAYDPGFISGVLVGAWGDVLAQIKKAEQVLPMPEMKL